MTVATQVILTSTAVFDAICLKATKMASDGLFCCLSLMGARWGFRQRQLELLPTGYSAAFRSRASLNPFAKGNQSGSRQGKMLLQQQNIKKKRTVGPNMNGSTVQERKSSNYQRSGIIHQLIAICLSVLCRRLPLSLAKDTTEIHRILIAQAMGDLGNR